MYFLVRIRDVFAGREREQGPRHGRETESKRQDGK